MHLLAIIRAPASDRARLALENLVVRQQLNVLRRGVKRARPKDSDRVPPIPAPLPPGQPTGPQTPDGDELMVDLTDPYGEIEPVYVGVHHRDKDPFMGSWDEDWAAPNLNPELLLASEWALHG